MRRQAEWNNLKRRWKTARELTLDLCTKHVQYKVEPSDLRELAQIFSRGGFTEGYLFGNHGKNLMSGDISKHQGIYIGKVVNGYASQRAGMNTIFAKTLIKLWQHRPKKGSLSVIPGESNPLS